MLQRSCVVVQMVGFGEREYRSNLCFASYCRGKLDYLAKLTCKMRVMKVPTSRFFET